MFQQIIGNTPVWVWSILAFLIYRGIVASRDRETSLKAIFLIPFIMLMLSLQSIVTRFGSGVDVILCWLSCAIVGTLMAGYFIKKESAVIDRARGTIWQRGSWMPLMLMMCVFFTRYIVTVAVVRDPSHLQDALFIDGACALYGLFNGLFFGRPLHIALLSRDVTSAA